MLLEMSLCLCQEGKLAHASLPTWWNESYVQEKSTFSSALVHCTKYGYTLAFLDVGMMLFKMRLVLLRGKASTLYFPTRWNDLICYDFVLVQEGKLTRACGCVARVSFPLHGERCYWKMLMFVQERKLVCASFN
jgi:hypothetical protein